VPATQLLIILALLTQGGTLNDSYLQWTEKQAIEIGKSLRATTRVAGTGRGLLGTEKSRSYKIRVTSLAPEVIRATARLQQIRGRLTDEQTRALVSTAEAAGDTAFMIEIDPDEGSGVVPSDWQVFLQSKRGNIGQFTALVGQNLPALREVKALGGVFARNYDYDVYWIIIQLCNNEGKRVIASSDGEVELVVRIENKEGRTRFRVPESIKRKMDCK
jgi:hypothetical protein